MKTIVKQVLILSNIVLGLTACGTDANQAATAALENTSKAESTTAPADTISQSVNLASDMPECNKAREGQLVMVESEGVLYVCKSKAWEKSELSAEAIDTSAIQAPKGDKGEKGDKGDAGIGTAGAQGAQGAAGAAGQDADAKYLEVNDAILTSIAAAPAGTKISVLFNGTTLITNSVSLQLKGAGNFQTTAGDLFELVSLGNSKWKELARSVSAESFSRVRMYTNNPALATGWTKMIYDYENLDTQSEYDPSTGDFTAKQKGVYSITGNFTTSSSAWIAGGSCGLGIYVNGQLVSIQTQVMPTVTTGCAATTAKSMELNVGDTVSIYGYVSRSGSSTYIDASADYNSMTITKVR